MSKNKYTKLTDKVFISALLLYPVEEFGEIDLVIEKGKYLYKKNMYVNAKIVNKLTSEWEDIIGVRGKTLKKALRKLLGLLTKKIKNISEIKYKTVSPESYEKITKIIANMDKDVAFWEAAKKADEEEEMQGNKKIEAPINTTDSTEEELDEQLSLKF